MTENLLQVRKSILSTRLVLVSFLSSFLYRLLSIFVYGNLQLPSGDVSVNTPSNLMLFWRQLYYIFKPLEKVQHEYNFLERRVISECWMYSCSVLRRRFYMALVIWLGK